LVDVCPEQVIGYGPGRLVAVAVVVQLSVPVSEEGVSPFTNVAYVAVKVGFATPNARDTLLAVIDNGTAVIDNVPFT